MSELLRTPSQSLQNSLNTCVHLMEVGHSVHDKLMEARKQLLGVCSVLPLCIPQVEDSDIRFCSKDLYPLSTSSVP